MLVESLHFESINLIAFFLQSISLVLVLMKTLPSLANHEKKISSVNIFGLCQEMNS